MDPVIPQRVTSRARPRKDEIKELLDAITMKSNLSFTSRMVFVSMAVQPPERRLAMNLRIVLGLSALGEVKNPLEGGLTVQERRALCDLDAANLPLRLREVAHGLLNIHERWLLLTSLARSFKEARTSSDQFLSPEELP